MPSISRFCLIHLIALKNVYCHGVRPVIFHDNSLHVLFWYHSFRCVAHNTDMCIDFFLKILSGRNPSTCAKEEVFGFLADKKNTVMYIPWTFGFLRAVGADRDVCWEALGMCGGIISINRKDPPSIFRKSLYPLFQMHNSIQRYPHAIVHVHLRLDAVRKNIYYSGTHFHNADFGLGESRSKKIYNKLITPAHFSASH